MAADDENNNVDEDQSNNNGSSSSSSTCRVYDTEDLFTFAVQLILGLIAVTVLYWKRYFEHPRRLFAIWFLDVSKQGIGCIYAHILNMIMAAVLSRQHIGNNGTSSTSDDDDYSSVDECAWYGISFVIDTTVGLALSLALLHYLEKWARRYDITPLVHLGVYTGDTAMYHWTIQLLAWLAILSVAKLVIYIFMYLCAAPLLVIATLLFTKPFAGRRRWELVFVMILMPAVLNCVYFWIADNNLKAGDDETAAHEVESDAATDQYHYNDMGSMQELPRNKSADHAAAAVTATAGERRSWTVFAKNNNTATGRGGGAAAALNDAPAVTAAVSV
jgi:hypothetical protein